MQVNTYCDGLRRKVSGELKALTCRGHTIAVRRHGANHFTSYATQSFTTVTIDFAGSQR
jgi:hypothetical protein